MLLQEERKARVGVLHGLLVGAGSPEVRNGVGALRRELRALAEEGDNTSSDAVVSGTCSSSLQGGAPLRCAVLVGDNRLGCRRGLAWRASCLLGRADREGDAAVVKVPPRVQPLVKVGAAARQLPDHLVGPSAPVDQLHTVPRLLLRESQRQPVQHVAGVAEVLLRSWRDLKEGLPLDSVHDSAGAQPHQPGCLRVPEEAGELLVAPRLVPPALGVLAQVRHKVFVRVRDRLVAGPGLPKVGNGVSALRRE
mmetsp:Transcript_7354/g.18883  ORF Transcript_7354/g.18883 Transcript_7354/m.18883 type:complete len:251 (+) Transcript_7354:1066-1818(+)